MKPIAFLFNLSGRVLVFLPFLAFAPPLGAQNPRPSPPGGDALRRHLQMEARQLHQRHSDALIRFEQSLERARNRPDHQARLDTASERAASRCAEFPNALRLISLVANDSLRGGQAAPGHVQNLIRDDIHAWSEPYLQEIRAAIAELEREVSQINRDVAYLFATALPSDVPELSVSPGPTENVTVRVPLRQLGLSSTFLAGGLVLDVVSVARTRLWITLPDQLVRVTWRIFRGKAAQAGTSLGMTLLDGPAPIGSVLTVAGLVWTFYDIHAALNQFQREMQAEIKTTLTSQREETHRQALEAGRRWVGQQRRGIDDAVRQILAPQNTQTEGGR